MDAASRLRVRRVVLASSCSVYGATDGSPSLETDRPGPLSPYAVTKLAAEQLCLAHAARPGTAASVIALRYFTVYGPRQRPDMLIHRVLTSALGQTPLRLFGNGHQQRDFTYVDDAVRATIAAALAPVANTVINVGGGTSTSIADVLDVARQLTGRPVPAVRSAAAAGDAPATLAIATETRPRRGPAVGRVSRCDQSAGVDLALDPVACQEASPVRPAKMASCCRSVSTALVAAPSVLISR